MTRITSHTMAQSVTLDFADGRRVTITTADARPDVTTPASVAADTRPQEAILIPSDPNGHGATNQPTLDRHESRSAVRIDPIATVTQDNPTMATRDNMEHNVSTERAEEIRNMPRVVAYRKFFEESSPVYVEYGRQRRDALIGRGLNSKDYQVAVSKIGAEFKEIMSDLIMKYAAVEDFDVEFEKTVIDAEVSHPDVNTNVRSLFVVPFIIGLIFGLTIGCIIGLSCA